MSEYERVPLEPWSAVADNLREFAADGEVSESGEGIEITVGSATLLVAKDGRVAAEMPFHEFEAGDVDALYFDHDRGAVRVEAGDVSYEFRRPG